MKDIGQSPVVTKKEVNGFLLNRLQYAVIMEAWRLVEVHVIRLWVEGIALFTLSLCCKAKQGKTLESNAATV